MARKKKGRPLHGWLILDKPAGITSTAAVNRARWLFQTQKAGHAGTLDPLATGLLAIAFGEATKTIPYVTDALKAYRFSVAWGVATNTDDAEGEPIATSDNRPGRADILAAIPKFVGDIMQVPPAFSAIRIDGERAYAKAREGEDVTLDARPLFVESLDLITEDGPNAATFEMVCGKGGYVRAVARDLGKSLGTQAHVTALRRLWSGPFELEDAAPGDILDRERGDPDLDAHLLPLEAGLADLPEQKVNEIGAARIRNGNPGPVTYSDLDYGDECWVSFQGQPIAVGTYHAGTVAPSRVFVYSAS